MFVDFITKVSSVECLQLPLWIVDLQLLAVFVLKCGTELFSRDLNLMALALFDLNLKISFKNGSSLFTPATLSFLQRQVLLYVNDVLFLPGPYRRYDRQ